MAHKLYLQGEAARREQAGNVTTESAVAFYSEAVGRSPQFADAWGGLALAYCDLLEFTAEDQHERIATLSRSASNRCLELDPSNVSAGLANLLVPSPFRRWAEVESSVEPLARKAGKDWTAAAHLGALAADNKQLELAIERFRQAIAIEPMLPRVLGQLAYAYWASGRLHEAEQMIEQAIQRWPRSWRLWNIKFQILAFEGQLKAAERQILNESLLPWNMSPNALPKRQRLIHALASGDPSARADSVKAYLAEGREHVRAVRNAALPLAALGADDALIDLLTGYYLGAGQMAFPISPYSRRPTYFLFLPPLRRLHSNPRFARLKAAIGLA